MANSVESASGIGHFKIATFSILSGSIYFWVSAFSGKVPELVWAKTIKYAERKDISKLLLWTFDKQTWKKIIQTSGMIENPLFLLWQKHCKFFILLWWQILSLARTENFDTTHCSSDKYYEIILWLEYCGKVKGSQMGMARIHKGRCKKLRTDNKKGFGNVFTLP